MAARSDAPSTDPSAEPAPQRAVFRMPLIAVVLLPVLAAFCLGPIATVNVWWSLLLLVPVLIGVAVLLTRTVVDGQAISVHGLRPTRRLRWEELDRLEFSGPRWAVAVGTDERRIRLPMVRPRDLPVLAAVSGGYLTFTAPPEPGSEAEPADADTPDGETPPAPAPAATPLAEPAEPTTPSGGRTG
ncbi:PH domain-containing protein [Nakamurella flava]|uniref:PH domain-containing protein n=1 Tax=Nakamurella flava TaxID=2576308 RepID=A0A4V6CWA8_9ACTN|nr:PH domain-containing protein [Nakamurella flava]TKV61445.1 PH domain-containing protein [Nakamurella flava]